MTANTILETRGLTIAFGGLVAVRDVDLKVAAGEIHGVIGPNGSGKTTLLNAVSGIYRPTRGEIRLGGLANGLGSERADGKSPAALVRLGVARTFQNIRLFPTLSVLENVKVATYSRTRSSLLGIFAATRGVVAEEARVESAAREALAFVGLADLAGARPGDLPYGKQRLVEIARALVAEPRLLLLDEPAAGMSLDEKRRLADLVRTLNRESGIAVLVIEHDMRVISGLCHQVTALNFGEVIARGTPAEVRAHPRVVEAYLGSGGAGRSHRRRPASATERVEARVDIAADPAGILPVSEGGARDAVAV
jgi:branched-chain amino acid transport system ATP-binding protein